jgi:hypothetical protein
VSWTVIFHPDFEPEFAQLPEPVQLELLGRLQVLAEFGPTLGRPNVDTLKGSSFRNMKELRFRLDGLWRFAFAFDPNRQAVMLVGGNKLSANQKAFYADLISVADKRFAAYVAELKRARSKE